jgi:hypothetical protein
MRCHAFWPLCDVLVRLYAFCVVRQKGLCGSCLIRVTSMHDTKSIRIIEDDVT